MPKIVKKSRVTKGKMARELVYYCLWALTAALAWAMVVKTAALLLDRTCDLSDVLVFAGAAFGGEGHTMDNIKKRLGNLLSVKSLVTLVLTGVFAYMAVAGKISQDFMTIYAVIIAFYFGTQSQKLQDAVDEKGGGEA